MKTRTAIRAATSLLACTVLIFSSGVPAWAAPANDNLSDAVTLSPLPFADQRSTVGATLEAGEPTPSCAPVGATVWYSAPAPTGLELTTFGSKFDTVLAAYSGTGLGDLTEVACNDDDEARGSMQSRAYVPPTESTLFIQVGGFEGTSGSLKLSAVETPRDDFLAAVPIRSLPFATTVDMSGTTSEPGEPGCYGRQDYTTWFRITPATTTGLMLDTTGTDVDTILAVFTGTGLSNLELVACNDDHWPSWAARVAFTATAETTYFIQLAAWYDPGVVPFTVEAFDPPSNDDFANTAPLAFPSKTRGSTYGATVESGEPESCVYEPTASVWYSFQTAETVPVFVGLDADFWAAVSVFTGDELGSLDLESCGYEASFLATPGTRYLIQVTDYFREQGDFELRLRYGVAADAFVVGAKAETDGSNAGAGAWVDGLVAGAGGSARAEEGHVSGCAFVYAVVIGTGICSGE